MGNAGAIICITALAGVGGTGLGGAFAALFRRDSGRTVSLLLSFAAGVMTSVVCFDLLTDALYPENGAKGALWMVIVGVLLGYVVIALLNAWIDRHTMKGPSREKQKKAEAAGQGIGKRRQLFVAGLVMAAAIALHNMPEGMIIGASFAKDSGIASLSRSGLVMAVVIGLHNIPEGMAVAVPLISGGMRRRNAVGVTAASGFPTVLGAVLGYFLGTLGERALCLCLSFASGAMLYVVFGELLPEASRLWQSKLPAFAAVVGMLVGMLIVYA